MSSPTTGRSDVQLTKYTHACVRLDDGDRRLVLDPGVFSPPGELDAALDGVDAVLLTHEHPDHTNVDRLVSALAANSRLQVFGTAGALAALGGADDERLVAVHAGLEFTAGGFAVRTFGGQHAVIHPSIPVIANLGYLIEGVYHPGDSFAVPSTAVATVLVPSIAPWSKAAEVIDFAVSVRAPQAFQIHDAIASDTYASMIEGHLGRIAAPFGLQFRHLAPGETVSV